MNMKYAMVSLPSIYFYEEEKLEFEAPMRNT